jgi:hypothetical protein
MVEFFGGADIELAVDLYDVPLSRYATPTYAMPALLVSGGSDDVWPGGGFDLVDFQAGTESLVDSLATDGHYVVHCEHDDGHLYFPSGSEEMAWEWLLDHTYGEDSPYLTSGIGDFGDWCAEVETGG